VTGLRPFVCGAPTKMQAPGHEGGPVSQVPRRSARTSAAGRRACRRSPSRMITPGTVVAYRPGRARDPRRNGARSAGGQVSRGNGKNNLTTRFSRRRARIIFNSGKCRWRWRARRS